METSKMEQCLKKYHFEAANASKYISICRKCDGFANDFETGNQFLPKVLAQLDMMYICMAFCVFESAKPDADCCKKSSRCHIGYSSLLTLFRRPLIDVSLTLRGAYFGVAYSKYFGAFCIRSKQEKSTIVFICCPNFFCEGSMRFGKSAVGDSGLLS